MPRYRIVVADEAKAHDAFIRSYQKHHPQVAAELRLHRDVWLRATGAGAPEMVAAEPGTPIPLRFMLDKTTVRVPSERRPVGTVHAEAMDTDCPDVTCADCGAVTPGVPPGSPCRTCEHTNTRRRPNCRNCGDPAHAEACKAKGHCPSCGTQHGIAPASVLAANGYVIEPED